MKTTFRFIIAAMAAIAVFSSCQKELANETANKTTDGVRTISVQFDNSTKASLSGFKPSFTNNDKIRVSNSEKSEERTVSVDASGNATFTTTLSGELTAIYPADAAVFTPGTSEAPDGKITSFEVSTSQTGELKDAIIAKATIAENSSEATFQGQTAVFRITPGAGASTSYVEVITAGPEIANTTSGEYTKKNKIHVATTVADEVFVSVLVPAGGLKLRDLSFADGSNMKTVTDVTKGATAINPNTIYTIASSGWDRKYVEIQMTVNGETKKYKWATRNIGATADTGPDSYGIYFAWGDVNGQEADPKTGTSPIANAFNSEFSWDNCPYAKTAGPKFDKYVPTDKESTYWGGDGSADNKTVLDLADDAANANWGGSWRMPTKEEFDALANLSGSAWDPTNKGYNFGTSPSTIFLPAAGYGSGTVLYFAGDNGTYWSSSLNTATPSRAYYLSFDGGDASTNDYGRFYGQSVRALSE